MLVEDFAILCGMLSLRPLFYSRLVEIFHVPESMVKCKQLATFNLKLLIHRSSLISIRNLSFHSTNVESNNVHLKSISREELKTLILSHYARGRFRNLMRNVIASTSVLLSACRNLSCSRVDCSDSSSIADLVSIRFPIEELGRELRENKFDIEESCFKCCDSSKNENDPLVFPNLRLKTVMEAIRMVLELIYDDRFVTFSYGGRVGMGRHTAIRYLKNYVNYPNWWFVLHFDHVSFNQKHVTNLRSIMEEKIEDIMLTEFVTKLFEKGAVKIVLGGSFFGRGFPQESCLSSIFLNIYLNGFDTELQRIRLLTEKKNPNFSLTKTISSENIFYKPPRIQAIRYLDEILVIVSGSKKCSLELKHWVFNFLEGLELKVDRSKTDIHSAVSEKIEFLGMVIQAVPPSLLRYQLSEKAIRAKKKHQRRKEVKALHLKNSRETKMKKLGLKVFQYVLKKLKKGKKYEFEYRIEDEVDKIVRAWADEVASGFFGSIEECREWHHVLSGGDFLSLPRIRNRLPADLVNAYDRFQKQVDKHLVPVEAMKTMEENQRREKEKEGRRYSQKTVDDLSALSIKVDAPIEGVRAAVRMVGFTNKMGRPRPVSFLIVLEDADIVKWFAGVGRRWLEFFCCCRNFESVKTVVTYHLRFSCLLTLAEKHGTTKKKAVVHYTKELMLSGADGSKETHFPTESKVKGMGDRGLVDPKPVDGALSLSLIRLVSDERSFRCVAHFCERTDTLVYRLRLLQDRLGENHPKNREWVVGIGRIHGSLNRKCFPLCSDHISDLYLGKITLQDLDCSSVLDVD